MNCRLMGILNQFKKPNIYHYDRNYRINIDAYIHIAENMYSSNEPHYAII